MILVDTSVWLDHWRRSDPHLVQLMALDMVSLHPLVLGELACGGIRQRERTLARIRLLRPGPFLKNDDVLNFVVENKLFGKGIGIVDAHLLAAARQFDLSIWTHDQTLREFALRFAALHLPR